MWISIYTFDFQPEGLGICVMVQLLIEGFPGFLFMEDKLCFNSGLKSIYFCLSVR